MKKPPKVVWCVVDAVGLTAVYGRERNAQKQARVWDECIGAEGPHTVHRYVLSEPAKKGVRRG